MLKINHVNRDVLEKKDESQELESESVRSRLFGEFSELEPDGDVLQINVTSPKQGRYVRALAYQFNNKKTSGKKLHTKVDKDRNEALIYASHAN